MGDHDITYYVETILQDHETRLNELEGRPPIIIIGDDGTETPGFHAFPPATTEEPSGQ